MNARPGAVWRPVAWGMALGAVLAAAGCDRRAAAPGPAAAPAPRAETPAAMHLTSPAFLDGERLTAKYTGDGADLSPPLAWTDPPAGTKALALVCDDLDAPRGTWNHWVLWNLPPDRRTLAEGVPKVGEPPGLGGARQGSNSWPRLGWGGPTPPPGTGVHRYVFTLYALDRPLDLEAGATRSALVAALEGRILARAAITGTYSH